MLRFHNIKQFVIDAVQASNKQKNYPLGDRRLCEFDANISATCPKCSLETWLSCRFTRTTDKSLPMNYSAIDWTLIPQVILLCHH